MVENNSSQWETQPVEWGTPSVEELSVSEVVGFIRARCPWSARLSHTSLLTYLFEETYELAEAVEEYQRGIVTPSRDGTRHHLEEELGDVLYQVLLHCALLDEFVDSKREAENEAHAGAEERRFPRSTKLYSEPLVPVAWKRVQSLLKEKLVRRHPHVFSSQVPWSLEDVEHNYLRIKTAEKEQSPVREEEAPAADSPLPSSMPALARAQAILNRRNRLSTTHSSVEDNGRNLAEDIGQELWDIVCRAQANGVDAEAALHTVLASQTEFS